MRKNIFLSLLGLVIGIGLFCLNEGYNWFLIVGLSLCGLVFFKKSLSYLFLSLVLGFILGIFSFNSYKLNNYKNLKLDISIIEKIDNTSYYTYIVKAKNNEYRLEEKSIFTSKENFEIGDRLRAKCEINFNNKKTNPYLFNYRTYLLSKKIKSRLEIKEYKRLDKSKLFFLRAKKKFREYITRIFDKNLSKKSSDFVKSLVLNQKYDDISTFSSLGISHILAISGIHIDLILGFMVFLLVNLGLSYRYSMPISIGISILYAYLIGFPFSILRVILFHLINFLAFILKKPRDLGKNLMMSLFLILIVNPFAVFSQSLWLSFLAGFAIYIIYPKFRKDKSYIKNKLIFIGILQVTMFSIIIYFYQTYNLITILANFLIIPIFEISAYIIFVIILTYPILMPLLKLVFIGLDFLIGSIINIAIFLNSFNLFKLSFPKESILISLYFLILVFIFTSIRHKKNKYMKYWIFLSLILVIFSIGKDKSRPPTFSMLDIGQGDCFILEDEGKIYLFDAGEVSFGQYSSTKKVLIPYLRARGVKNIEAIFISHEDKDHCGALPILKKEFRIKQVFVNKYNTKSFKGYNLKILKDNDRIQKKDIIIDVLKNFDGEENDQSMPLLINIKGNKILTMGDLSKAKEEIIARNADILKISHHGSKSSTSRKFLKDVDPKVALISAGRKNIYGHPSKEVLKNLSDIRVFNTQDDGYVRIEFYDGSFKVNKYVKGGFFR